MVNAYISDAAERIATQVCRYEIRWLVSKKLFRTFI